MSPLKSSMCRWVHLAVAALLILGIGAVLWVGDDLSRPAPADTGLPPPELHAHQVTFESGSGALLSSWFIPGITGRGAVLLLHPVRANKRTMLRRAQFLHRAGLAVLLVDLQAHGESSGARITFGYRDADDVRAAAAQLAALAPGEKLGALGVSLGAAAVLLSDSGNTFAAVILESLYSTIEEAVANRLRIGLGPAGPLLSTLLLAQLWLCLHISPSQLRPIDHFARLHAAVLIVHGVEDRQTTLPDAQRLFSAARDPKELFAIAGAAHQDLHAYAGREYEQRISGFLACDLR